MYTCITMPDEAAARIAANLQRLIAKRGWTLAQTVEATSVDERTLRGILSGKQKSQARTLHKLAEGLEISVDELFQEPSQLAYRAFDRVTNPVVDEVVETHPEIFRGWTEVDFNELYSRFGAGGALTFEGAKAAAEKMNRKHDLLHKANIILETHEADLLAELIEVLYKRVSL